MERVMRKLRTLGAVLLVTTALLTVFTQFLTPRCMCGPMCAMQEETVARAGHACCESTRDTSSPHPVSVASLVKQCNCPPALHEAAPVIANATEHGPEQFKVFAIAAAFSYVAAAQDFGHGAISESPPPAQDLIILNRSLRC